MVITYARQRMLYGRTTTNLPSRFVDELPAESVKRIGAPKPSYQQTEPRQYGSFGRVSIYGDSYNDFSQIPTRPKPQKDYSVHTAPKPAPKVSFAAGEMVQHKAFGRGMILTVLPMGNDALLEIAFEKAVISPALRHSLCWGCMEMSRRKRRRRRILLIALLLVITGLILLTQLHLSPYIRELARNQAVNAASNAITGSVSEMLRTGNTDFSRVIVLEKDVQGNITALRTDMGQVERMKIEVLGALDGLIDQINTQQMGIPLGNLLLPDLLAGTGPVLPVKAVSLTVSNADFFSDFSEAGINQTLQTLKVKFTISLTILTTVGYESVDVDSDVMVAQTVIVGRVPETYVNLGHLTAAEGWDQYGTETADRTADPGT